MPGLAGLTNDAAWYDMSRILGKGFASFLPVVIPPLLNSASVGFAIGQSSSCAHLPQAFELTRFRRADR